jgi:hypothetical protein
MIVAEAKLLAVMCELGVPDRLPGRRRASATELANEVGADPDALERVMRYLASLGWFSRTRDGRYRLRSSSQLLRADASDSLRDWVRFMGSDWNWRVWNEAEHAVRTGEPAAVAALGRPFFEWIHQDSRSAGTVFDGAMRSLSALAGPMLAKELDLGRHRSVCDIGGGTGTTLAAVLDAAPHLLGTVYDLPEVVAAAPAVVGRLTDERWESIGGDFFESVPAGHDLYILQAILHDWDDERASVILGNVRRAMAPDGRVVVVESVLEPRARFDMAKATDVLMLMLADGGRERTIDEFEQLAARTGFRLERRGQLPLLIWALTLAPV